MFSGPRQLVPLPRQRPAGTQKVQDSRQAGHRLDQAQPGSDSGNPQFQYGRREKLPNDDVAVKFDDRGNTENEKQE